MTYCAFLFWAIVYPLSFRRRKLSGQIRYMHVISVALAVILPLLTGLLPLKDGFVTTQYPTITCLPRSTDYVYAVFVLPVCTLLACAMSLMAVVFWVLCKVIYVATSFN